MLSDELFPAAGFKELHYINAKQLICNWLRVVWTRYTHAHTIPWPPECKIYYQEAVCSYIYAQTEYFKILILLW